MDKFDIIVLETLAGVAFTPERVEAMMLEFRRLLQQDGGHDLKTLTKRQEVLRIKLRNAYKAVSEGIELDDFFREELENLKRQEAETTAKINNYQDLPQAVVSSIDREEKSRHSASP